MPSTPHAGPRVATVADAPVVARLLRDFNREFDTPTPEVEVLAHGLQRVLASDSLFALLIDEPAVGLAVVSLRPNVWHEGPVALLDELYVAPGRRNEGRGGQLLARARREARGRGAELMEINVDAPDTDARRFYERHGFSCIEPTTGDIALYYYGSTAEAEA